ncbi:helix-turn-helix domain-containing protein [Streptomyces himalayensis]|uniref:Helix-turn-helix domain-containing protein n=1 Tax=Streptomyces himalayensis subsp. himalayensis TaxID=2756131 RepID=A0A7W0I7T8_9ACTN|nr:helix-turn-helix transcriptional regulator [Streptomyces himalayensis]MBA2945289.1 helix-turn-helix domain-containing protein [Streptomyces himalayensis subsp. himalayensis]
MPRKQPTARQERLGRELRKLREAAGLTAREAAGMLGAVSVTMSQIESGVAGVSEARVRRLAAHYACTDAELIDALVEMATDRTRGWWEEYRDVLPPVFQDLAELEHHARFMQVVGTAHVPGLLQTEEYARAVFAYVGPELPESELELRVEHRMRRRQVLAREEAAPYEALVHESVLRTRVADRRVARAQLDELLSQSERPNVSVRVIPFDVDGFAGAGATMLYAGGRVPALDTVQRDAPYGSVFVDASAKLMGMRTLFRRVEKAAVTPAKSRDFIRRLTKEL